MEGYKIPPVFHHYQEALGRDNIKLAIVDEQDPLDFINPETDVVLLRTASKSLVETIHKMGVRSTAETFDKYEYASDKKNLSSFLRCKHIPVPNQYYIDEIIAGKKYFVKPRYGSESFGISEKSICKSKHDVVTQVDYLSNVSHKEALIEEYIEGVDCTVACYIEPITGKIHTHAIKIECSSEGGVQTHQGKFGYDEICSSLVGKEKEYACNLAYEAFRVIGLKHHARIDFRMTSDGKMYLIDVNLIPGLGPLAHFAKCLLLTENRSYIDSLKAILNSASK